MNLPHQYPFRFVEEAAGDGMILCLSAGGRYVDSRGLMPQMLTLEMLAQACFFLLPDATDEPVELALAGIENARFGAAPRAGDRLRATGELVARFGPMVRVKARLTRDEELLTEAELLLARSARA